MKLSQKYYRNSRASALQATLALFVTAASACWLPGAIIENHQGANPLYLFGLIAAGIGSAIWAIIAAKESARLYKLGLDQQVYEYRRSIRPRI